MIKPKKCGCRNKEKQSEGFMFYSSCLTQADAPISIPIQQQIVAQPITILNNCDI
ncbi:MAG: hypothetical protein WAM14_00570 [Candidatus Nitrosopolaris sp.]